MCVRVLPQYVLDNYQSCVSYRIVLSDTIRYGAICYRFALKKRKYAIRYDAIRPNATAIRPANDTIRYDTPEKVGKYVSFVSFVSYRSVSHSSDNNHNNRHNSNGKF